MYCTNCNYSLTANSKFCPSCGEKVEFSDKTVQSQTRDNGSARFVENKPIINFNFKKIVPILLVGVILLGAYMFLGSGNKPDATVSKFFESVMNNKPDELLDTLSSPLRYELMDYMDLSELAYELNDVNYEITQYMGPNWIKNLDINTDYEYEDNAVVNVNIVSVNGSDSLKVKLYKENKKWVIVDIPDGMLPW